MEVLIAEIQKRSVLWNKRNLRYKDRYVVDREWGYVAERVGLTKDEAKKKWRNLRDQFTKEFKKIPKPKSGNPASDYPGKWQYFSALLFLKDTLTPRDTESNVPNVDPLATVVHDALTVSEESDWDNRNSNILSDEDSLAPPSSTNSGALGAPSNTPVSTSQRLQTNTKASSQTSTSHSKRKKKKSPEKSVERQLLEIESKKLAFLDQPDDDDLMFLKSLLPYFKQMHPIQKLRIRSKFQNIIIEEMTHPVLSMPNNLATNTNSSSASSVVTHYSQMSSASTSNTNRPNINKYSDIPSPQSSVSLQSPNSNISTLEDIKHNETYLPSTHYTQY